jgi:hypothetical protein
MPSNEQQQSYGTSNQQQNDSERAQRISDKVERATEHASETALAQVEHIRDRAQSGIEQGREQVTGRIRRVGSALRSAGEGLREEDEGLAGYADMLVSGIDQLADYVDHADMRSVARDVTSFARSQPVPFFGGAFILGLALGRFVKAASEGEGHESGSQSGPQAGSQGSQESGGPYGFRTSQSSQGYGDQGFGETFSTREPRSP